MFALDLVFWCVTSFFLLTLVCSAAFVVYLCGRKIFESLLVVPLPGGGAARPALSELWATSAGARMAVASIGRDISTRSTGADAAIAGPWGPIDQGLHPEIARKIERVMAVGVSMRDAAGNLCPHPIAPRVALAIVEALQGHP